MIAKNFVIELLQFGHLISYQNQKQVPGKEYGLKYDVVGKTDFEFEEWIVDTKATAYIRRLKAGHVDPKWYPKEADLRQQFLYRELFKKNTMLLYCSYKDSPCPETFVVITRQLHLSLFNKSSILHIDDASE